jgi:uncharacterized protein (TIGR03382 family)
MKRITIALAVVMLFFVVPAHADTFDFTWQSEAWLRLYETPTQASVIGPLTLSGSGTATFAELAGGGATLTFDGAFGGTLVATGDGTFNGSMSFPTADNGARNGLGVLTPTADGFTVTVHRAASGPDAGATFLGSATRVATGTPATVAASEPLTIALTMAGLITAGVVSRRRRA